MNDFNFRHLDPAFQNQTYDPEQRLAMAIVRTVADDYMDESWLAYCYKMILIGFEKTDEWQQCKKAYDKINAVRTQVIDLRGIVQRNAVKCKKLGGRTENSFPYKPVSKRYQKCSDADYARQQAVNLEYKRHWSEWMRKMDELEKKVFDLWSEIKNTSVPSVNKEHEDIVHAYRYHIAKAQKNLEWFSTETAHIYMMSDIPYQIIARQLEKRSQANIRRMKKARQQAGMHPFDVRKDTKEQKIELTRVLNGKKGVTPDDLCP